jgi:hypothetical protein
MPAKAHAQRWQDIEPLLGLGTTWSFGGGKGCFCRYGREEVEDAYSYN